MRPRCDWTLDLSYATQQQFLLFYPPLDRLVLVSPAVGASLTRFSRRTARIVRLKPYFRPPLQDFNELISIAAHRVIHMSHFLLRLFSSLSWTVIIVAMWAFVAGRIVSFFLLLIVRRARGKVAFVHWGIQMRGKIQNGECFGHLCTWCILSIENVTREFCFFIYRYDMYNSLRISKYL